MSTYIAELVKARTTLPIRTNIATFAAACLTSCALLFGCGSTSGGNSTDVPDETTSQPYVVDETYNTIQSTLSKPNLLDNREIVCWGDSMTYGFGADKAIIRTADGTYDASNKSYPQILGHLTGMKTYNFGFPGTTSDEIAMLQGGLDGSYNEWVQQLRGDKTVKRAAHHTGDIIIIEIGSNGGWDNDYATLISQYWAMIDYAGCEDYLILGDTDDPGTSEGDLWQLPFDELDEDVVETDWEIALQEEFGDRFINVRTYLIDKGLSVCGLNATRQDLEDAELGCISQQLRSDWTHLNSYGYYAKAVAIYERGIELGFWR